VEVLAAALLHDTIEDTDTSFDELAREFGGRIAGMVAEVTDDKSLPKEERKRLQIEHAPAISHGAKLVKLADKICNLRDVADRPPGRRSVFPDRPSDRHDRAGRHAPRQAERPARGERALRDLPMEPLRSDSPLRVSERAGEAPAAVRRVWPAMSRS